MKTSSSWITLSRLSGETTGSSLRGLVAGRLSRVFLLLGCAITALLISPSAQAATRIKANNADALNLASSWDTLPGVADIASWTSTVNATNTVALGADLNWSGISIVGPGGLVTISAGNTLTLGSSGIDMSAATQDLTIQSGLALQSGVGEIWNIASGRTLTLGTGAFTRTAGSTLNVQGAGTVATTNISNDATGIVGTWATFGTGASTKYATVSGGNIVGYTGTAAATAANVTDTTGAVNYDVAAVGTLGAGASFNTLHYTGAAGSINGNFSANGILSAGAGALFMTGNITIGASRELVVTVPDTARNLTLSGVISDNASGSSALTKSGGNTSAGYLYLSGANTYTGLTTVSQGVLSISNSSALGSTNVGTVVTSAGRMEFQSVANSAELFYFNTISQSTFGVIGNSTQSGAIRTYGGLNFSGAVTGTINFTGGISTTNGAAGSPVNIAQGSALTENITVKPVSIGGGTMNSYGGTLVIGVAGNTWGASALYGGTWRTDVANALPTAATLSFDSSVTPASLLNLNGNSQTIGGIQTTGGGYKVAGGFTREVTSSSAATLTVSQISNNLNFDGAFTGAVSLVKAGLSTSNLHLPGHRTRQRHRHFVDRDGGKRNCRHHSCLHDRPRAGAGHQRHRAPGRRLHREYCRYHQVRHQCQHDRRALLHRHHRGGELLHHLPDLRGPHAQCRSLRSERAHPFQRLERHGAEPRRDHPERGWHGEFHSADRHTERNQRHYYQHDQYQQHPRRLGQSRE
jgi:autotransporter-associated beta strand protein